MYIFKKLDFFSRSDGRETARLCAFLHIPPVVLRRAALHAAPTMDGASEGSEEASAAGVVEQLEGSVEAVRAIWREATPEGKARRIVDARREAIKVVAEAYAAEARELYPEDPEEGGSAGRGIPRGAAWVQEDEVVPCIILATLKAASEPSALREGEGLKLRLSIRNRIV